MGLSVSPSTVSTIYPNESDLAAGLRQKDPAALARLYDLYGTIVYRVVLRMVNDEAAAEDIVQETFRRLWEHSSHIREDAVSAGPWMMAIARNRALDYMRLTDVRVALTGKPVESAELCVQGKDAEALIISDETARRIRLACSQLSENHRRVIELAYYHGLSQARIAQVMQEPLGTIKSWTRAALQSLRKSLVEGGGM